MKWEYSWPNILRGAIIYTSGDSIAALLLQEFQWSRLLGLALVGATFYAFEIPNYFQWIEKKAKGGRGRWVPLYKTALAILYFNPIWIARHLFFIELFSGQAGQVGWGLMRIALYSFLVNVPLSLLGNYVIQNVIGLRWRFFASAVFSALMAIYYAVSRVLF
ncbi:MAG: hypothetical protein H6573_17125 [Lewinellaceae bacterium]|nr:hypothetical protein [Phaeodactylibacter sp.]MCB0616182.1 hypothetical protein [Phaeodactylibacter sp.]MCB9349210.1 hypothetical protein [Lewinellaceae bacterium]